MRTEVGFAAASLLTLTLGGCGMVKGALDALFGRPAANEAQSLGPEAEGVEIAVLPGVPDSTSSISITTGLAIAKRPYVGGIAMLVRPPIAMQSEDFSPSEDFPSQPVYAANTESLVPRSGPIVIYEFVFDIPSVVSSSGGNVVGGSEPANPSAPTYSRVTYYLHAVGGEVFAEISGPRRDYAARFGAGMPVSTPSAWPVRTDRAHIAARARQIMATMVPNPKVSLVALTTIGEVMAGKFAEDGAQAMVIDGPGTIPEDPVWFARVEGPVSLDGGSYKNFNYLFSAYTGIAIGASFGPPH